MYMLIILSGSRRFRFLNIRWLGLVDSAGRARKSDPWTLGNFHPVSEATGFLLVVTIHKPGKNCEIKQLGMPD